MFLIKLFRHKARVAAINDTLCRVLYNGVGSLSKELLCPPELIGATELLTDEYRRKLCDHVPARIEGHEWTLAFTTSVDGFNLHTLYQRMIDVDGPVLLVIRDADDNVFGALLSEAPTLCHREHSYGTGESFLFRFTPEFKVYKWTGCNVFFIRALRGCMCIGGGDGKCGLWMDENLDKGRTEPCKTFRNEILSSQEDFHIMTLECWVFL